MVYRNKDIKKHTHTINIKCNKKNTNLEFPIGLVNIFDN